MLYLKTMSLRKKTRSYFWTFLLTTSLSLTVTNVSIHVLVRLPLSSSLLLSGYSAFLGSRCSCGESTPIPRCWSLSLVFVPGSRDLRRIVSRSLSLVNDWARFPCGLVSKSVSPVKRHVGCVNFKLCLDEIFEKKFAVFRFVDLLYTIEDQIFSHWPGLEVKDITFRFLTLYLTCSNRCF